MDWMSLKHTEIIELQLKGNLNPSFNVHNVLWLEAEGHLTEVIILIFDQVNCLHISVKA